MKQVRCYAFVSFQTIGKQVRYYALVCLNTTRIWQLAADRLPTEAVEAPRPDMVDLDEFLIRKWLSQKRAPESSSWRLTGCQQRPWRRPGRIWSIWMTF